MYIEKRYFLCISKNDKWLSKNKKETVFECITFKRIMIMKATTKTTLVRIGKGVWYFLLGLFTFYVIDCVYVDVKHAIADAWEESR